MAEETPFSIFADFIQGSDKEDYFVDENEILLNILLNHAADKWEISPDQIDLNMDKIAFHESKYGTKMYTPEQIGGGPGRGLFQFEKNVEGKGQGGANTAINRLIDEISLNHEDVDIPEWVWNLSESDYDVSNLSPEQQKIIFLGNLLQKPERGANYVSASFKGVDTDEELAAYWAQHHQAGTIIDTDEYKNIINKFTEDLNEGYRQGLLEE